MRPTDYAEGELLMRRAQVSQKVLPSVEKRLKAYAESVLREKDTIRHMDDSMRRVLRAEAFSNTVLAATVVRAGFSKLCEDNAVRVFGAVDHAIAGVRGLYRVDLLDERSLRSLARIAVYGAATAVKCGRVTDDIAEAYEEYEMSIGPDTDPAFAAKGAELYRWGHTLVREHMKSKLTVIRGGLH